MDYPEEIKPYLDQQRKLFWENWREHEWNSQDYFGGDYVELPYAELARRAADVELTCYNHWKKTGEKKHYSDLGISDKP